MIGYGPDYADIYRRAGSYISRILAGEKPADLPVQNPIKFRLVINLNAAKAPRCRYPRQVACGGRRGDRMSVASSSRVSLF